MDDTSDVLLIVYNATREVVREEPAPARCYRFLAWDFVSQPRQQPVVWDAGECRSLLQMSQDGSELLPSSSDASPVHLWVPRRRGRVDRLAAGVATRCRHKDGHLGVRLEAGLRVETVRRALWGCTTFVVGHVLPLPDATPDAPIHLLSTTRELSATTSTRVIEVLLGWDENGAMRLIHRFWTNDTIALQMTLPCGAKQTGDLFCHGFVYAPICDSHAGRIFLWQ
jgi:hypothetical protein